MLRYLIAVVVLCRAAVGVATAETTASSNPDVTVTIEESVAITGLDDIVATIVQTREEDTPPGMAAADVSPNGLVKEQFTVFKNCDVVLTIPTNDMLRHRPLEDPNDSDAYDDDEDCMQAHYYISGDGIHKAPVFSTGNDQRNYLAEWINCTEIDGEDWWLFLEIERHGLCDHAGIYTGVVTVDVTAWGHASVPEP